MADRTPNERDSKLLQWLGEAHTKESELEADLTKSRATSGRPSRPAVGHRRRSDLGALPGSPQRSADGGPGLRRPDRVRERPDVVGAVVTAAVDEEGRRTRDAAQVG